MTAVRISAVLAASVVLALSGCAFGAQLASAGPQFTEDQVAALLFSKEGPNDFLDDRKIAVMDEDLQSLSVDDYVDTRFDDSVAITPEQCAQSVLALVIADDDHAAAGRMFVGPKLLRETDSGTAESFQQVARYFDSSTDARKLFDRYRSEIHGCPSFTVNWDGGAVSVTQKDVDLNMDLDAFAYDVYVAPAEGDPHQSRFYVLRSGNAMISVDTVIADDSDSDRLKALVGEFEKRLTTE